jgi:uncharacterized membrane protein SpoIIM required for sporulation
VIHAKGERGIYTLYKYVSYTIILHHNDIVSNIFYFLFFIFKMLDILVLLYNYYVRIIQITYIYSIFLIIPQNC